MTTTKRGRKPSTTKTSVEERKNKTYKLVKGTPLSYMIKTGRDGNLLVWDEGKQAEVPIRHCPNDKSIYLEEQGDFAVVQEVVFVNGVLMVDSTKQSTQKFLDAHPHNKANGGRLFEEVNTAKEAEELIAETELRTIINMAIISKSKEEDGINELEAVVAVLGNSYDKILQMGVEELKRELYKEADRDPYQFVDDFGNVTIFDDILIKTKYLILKAQKLGVIEKTRSGNAMKWRNGDTFYTAPAGIKVLDGLAEFLGTDDGILVAGQIKKNI